MTWFLPLPTLALVHDYGYAEFMSDNTIKPRKYRRITPDVIKRVRAEVALLGNASAAIRQLEPDAMSPGERGFRILKKPESMSGAEYIDKTLDQIADAAIDRVNSMIQSTDERIATKNAHFVIDHVRGKALQRTENKNYNLTIEAILQ